MLVHQFILFFLDITMFSYVYVLIKGNLFLLNVILEILCNWGFVLFNTTFLYTVKLVLRVHLWDQEKLASYDWWPLKRGSIYMIWLSKSHLNTDDCLLEVTSWTCLTVCIYIYNCTSLKFCSDVFPFSPFWF